MPNDVFEVFDFAELLKHGVLPAEGGWMDQSATFTDAVAWVLQEREKYRKRQEGE